LRGVEARRCLEDTASNGRPSIGNPSSRGYPTWFVVPDNLGEAIERMLKPALDLPNSKQNHQETAHEKLERAGSTT
jgi:hypothetical protein